MRELQGLGDALREREDELGACAERLEKAASDAKSERARQASSLLALSVSHVCGCACGLFFRTSEQRFGAKDARGSCILMTRKNCFGYRALSR